jgi:hypothetical protein
MNKILIKTLILLINLTILISSNSDKTTNIISNDFLEMIRICQQFPELVNCQDKLTPIHKQIEKRKSAYMRLGKRKSAYMRLIFIRRYI